MIKNVLFFASIITILFTLLNPKKTNAAESIFSETDFACVKRGISKFTNMPEDKISEKWLALLGIAAQNFQDGHVSISKVSDRSDSRKRLIQLVQTYGFCAGGDPSSITDPKVRSEVQKFNDNYMYFSSSERALALSAVRGYRRLDKDSPKYPKISKDEQKELLASLGIRKTLFGDMLDDLFDHDLKDWSKRNPKERQLHFRNQLDESFGTPASMPGEEPSAVPIRISDKTDVGFAFNLCAKKIFTLTTRQTADPNKNIFNFERQNYGFLASETDPTSSSNQQKKQEFEKTKEANIRFCESIARECQLKTNNGKGGQIDDVEFCQHPKAKGELEYDEMIAKGIQAENDKQADAAEKARKKSEKENARELENTRRKLLNGNDDGGWGVQ